MNNTHCGQLRGRQLSGRVYKSMKQASIDVHLRVAYPEAALDFTIRLAVHIFTDGAGIVNYSKCYN